MYVGMWSIWSGCVSVHQCVSVSMNVYQCVCVSVSKCVSVCVCGCDWGAETECNVLIDLKTVYVISVLLFLWWNCGCVL